MRHHLDFACSIECQLVIFRKRSKYFRQDFLLQTGQNQCCHFVKHMLLFAVYHKYLCAGHTSETAEIFLTGDTWTSSMWKTAHIYGFNLALKWHSVFFLTILTAQRIHFSVTRWESCIPDRHYCFTTNSASRNSLNGAYVCRYVWDRNNDVLDVRIKSSPCALNPTLYTARVWVIWDLYTFSAWRN